MHNRLYDVGFANPTYFSNLSQALIATRYYLNKSIFGDIIWINIKSKEIIIGHDNKFDIQ